jgi:hypothetical protein
VPYLVAFASNVFTLEPGDVILTGTPAGVGWARNPRISLQDGDVVEVEVERVGVREYQADERRCARCAAEQTPRTSVLRGAKVAHAGAEHLHRFAIRAARNARCCHS